MYDARVRRALAITVVILAVLAVVVRIRYAPPAPVGRHAGTERFSAERARDVQRLVVGDAAPRPLGSEANARARRAIAEALGRAGLRVESQETLSCSHHGFCGHVSNVIGILEGRDASLAGEAVLLSAHYDSVAVSPGASDDGVGTAAVVETARALAAGPRPRHPVIVVDGRRGAGPPRRGGLRRESPYAKRVRAAVNVDARGSTGPSQMFETSPGNAWLVDAMATSLERPVTSSLFYEVYRRMPNNTDFTSFKRIAEGVNFANTAGIADYHTPRDALDAADPGTLQHHGDNLLAMARAFDDAPLGEGHTKKGDAVWFDVLAFGVVRWPRDWTLPIAIAVFILAAAQAFGLRARCAESSRSPRSSSRERWVCSPPVLRSAFSARCPRRGSPIHCPRKSRFMAARSRRRPARRSPSAGARARARSGRARGSDGRARSRRGDDRAGRGVRFVVPDVRRVPPTDPLFRSRVHPGRRRRGAPSSSLPRRSTTRSASPCPPSPARRPPLGRRARAARARYASTRAECARRGRRGRRHRRCARPAFSAAVPQRANVVFRQRETGAARVFVDTSWGPAPWGPTAGGDAPRARRSFSLRDRAAAAVVDSRRRRRCAAD